VPGMKLALAGSAGRVDLAFGEFRIAGACSTSALLIAGSRRISVAPRETRSPSLKRISLIRPATSGRTVIDSSERRLPTAVIDCGIGCTATLIASTATALDAPPLFGAAETVPAAVGAVPAVLCVPNQ